MICRNYASMDLITDNQCIISHIAHENWIILIANLNSSYLSSISQVAFNFTADFSATAFNDDPIAISILNPT